MENNTDNTRYNGVEPEAVELRSIKVSAVVEEPRNTTLPRYQPGVAMAAGSENPAKRYRKQELLDCLEKLRRTGKIERAALVDFDGNILIASPGLALGQSDIDAVLKALESCYTTLMIKLNIDGQFFTCFRNDSCTASLIGRAENDVLSIYKCVDFIAIGISDPKSPGSCIYEMSKFVKKCYRQSKRSSQADLLSLNND